MSITEPSSPPGRRERSDRERNRAAIIATAREAFARADAEGVPLSMNEVARSAGVGVATLYRHFPSREALAEAVYRVKVDELTERVRRSTAADDALVGLETWVREFALLMLGTRGMMDTLRAAWLSGSMASSDMTARIAAVLGGFIDAGRTDGSLPSDTDPMDTAIAVLALLSTAPPEGSGDRALRLLGLFVRGLSSRRSV